MHLQNPAVQPWFDTCLSLQFNKLHKDIFFLIKMPLFKVFLLAVWVVGGYYYTTATCHPAAQQGISTKWEYDLKSRPHYVLNDRIGIISFQTSVHLNNIEYHEYSAPSPACPDRYREGCEEALLQNFNIIWHH